MTETTDADSRQLAAAAGIILVSNLIGLHIAGTFIGFSGSYEDECPGNAEITCSTGWGGDLDALLVAIAIAVVIAVSLFYLYAYVSSE